MTPLQASSTRVWCKLTLMAAGKPDMDSTRFTVTLAFLRSWGKPAVSLGCAVILPSEPGVPQL